MARPKLAPRRRIPSPINVTEVPGLIEEPQLYWKPARGIDYKSKIDNVDLQHAAELTNLYLLDGRMKSRNPIVAVSNNNETVLGVAVFITSEQKIYLIRFSNTAAKVWNGSTWVSLPGTYSLTGSTSDVFAWTTFANTLVFSQGVDGLLEFDPATGLVSDLPNTYPARGLTTFAGRVIAWATNEAGTYYQRIRWSVKNNSHDWIGLGSGFEDLLSTPGGQVDRLASIVPVSDKLAFVIRSNSVWAMQQTGNVNAPFDFSRMFPGIGSESPRSVVGFPGGVAFAGKDDIYLVQQGGFSAVGDEIRSQIFPLTSPEQLVGSFAGQEYWLAVPEKQYVYRYSFLNKGWTRHKYRTNGASFLAPYPRGNTFLAIDGLVGKIDALVGKIDALVGASQSASMLVVVDNIVCLESTSAASDDYGAGAEASQIDVATAQLSAADPDHAVELIQVRFRYEASASQTLLFEYSIDGGTTWLPYGATGSYAIVATTKPADLVIPVTVTSKSVQVRVRSTTLGKLDVHSLKLDQKKDFEVRA